jgi:HEPN domain-containing protein
MTKHPVEVPREWLRYATGDLGVAEREMQSGSPSYHTVCFLCQSAAEKFLKGYLIAQGWTLEKTHDIAALLQVCTGYAEDWGSLAAAGAVLNEYIVTGCYPGDIVFEEIGRREAQEALTAVRQIEEHVRTLMKATG